MVRDGEVVAYVAATSAMERFCEDRLGPTVWAEAAESFVLVVGNKRTKIIRHFISDLATRSDQTVQGIYDELEPRFYDLLATENYGTGNPNQFYRIAVRVIDEGWAKLVQEERIKDGYQA